MTDRATHDALLRAILESPHDDAPRLVLADWYAENGEEAHGEFIRRSVYREADPFCRISGKREARWSSAEECKCPVCAEWRKIEYSTIMGEYVRSAPAGVQYIITRGFVDEVRVSVATFLGGACERCEGGALIHAPGPCPRCSGTGRVAGIGAELFARQPVLTVTLTDYRPTATTGHDVWSFIELDRFPPEVHPFLRYHDTGRFVDFGRQQDAINHLATGLASYGRSLVGLPPLPHHKRRPRMDDLIAALTIFRKYGNPHAPTHCEHDKLHVAIDPDLVSVEDLSALEKLSFHPDDEDVGGFYSFRFGSC